MTDPEARRTISLARSRGGEDTMATAVVDESRNEDWVDGLPEDRTPFLTGPETLWTLFAIAILIAFLAFAGLRVG